MDLANRVGQVEYKPEMVSRLRAGLGKLRRAYEYAQEVDHDSWDFAVEIGDLLAEGLDNSDLRWLVCKGYIEHAVEVSGPIEDRRLFQPTRRLRFSKRSCFALSPEGAEFAAQVLGDAVSANGFLAGQVGATCLEDPRAPRPRWDRDRQELSVGVVVVKRYKVPAPNQEMILAAFEEDGWPTRIDDPIPPQGDMDPRRRLHDTINSLNGCHLITLIRFFGDGTGQGVRWELVMSPPSANGCASSAGGF